MRPWWRWSMIFTKAKNERNKSYFFLVSYYPWQPSFFSPAPRSHFSPRSTRTWLWPPRPLNVALRFRRRQPLSCSCRYWGRCPRWWPRSRDCRPRRRLWRAYGTGWIFWPWSSSLLALLGFGEEKRIEATRVSQSGAQRNQGPKHEEEEKKTFLFFSWLMLKN